MFPLKRHFNPALTLSDVMRMKMLRETHHCLESLKFIEENVANSCDSFMKSICENHPARELDVFYILIRAIIVRGFNL